MAITANEAEKMLHSKENSGNSRDQQTYSVRTFKDK